MKLEWTHSEDVLEKFVMPALIAHSDGPTMITFLIDGEGDYCLSWHVTIDHRQRSAAQAQAFAAKIAHLINTLPADGSQE